MLSVHQKFWISPERLQTVDQISGKHIGIREHAWMVAGMAEVLLRTRGQRGPWTDGHPGMAALLGLSAVWLCQATEAKRVSLGKSGEDSGRAFLTCTWYKRTKSLHSQSLSHWLPASSRWSHMSLQTTRGELVTTDGWTGNHKERSWRLRISHS